MLLPAATAMLGFTRGARIAPIVTRAGKMFALGARSVVIARARSLEPAGRTVLAVGFRIAGIGTLAVAECLSRRALASPLVIAAETRALVRRACLIAIAARAVTATERLTRRALSPPLVVAAETRALVRRTCLIAIATRAVTATERFPWRALASPFVIAAERRTLMGRACLIVIATRAVAATERLPRRALSPPLVVATETRATTCWPCRASRLAHRASGFASRCRPLAPLVIAVARAAPLAPAGWLAGRTRAALATTGALATRPRAGRATFAAVVFVILAGHEVSRGESKAL
jgi:hypothetical protein